MAEKRRQGRLELEFSTLTGEALGQPLAKLQGFSLRLLPINEALLALIGAVDWGLLVYGRTHEN